MATVIKASVFAQKLKNIAANYKTLYVTYGVRPALTLSPSLLVAWDGEYDGGDWDGYIKYLHKWAVEHSDKGFEGCCPVCYDEWLDCDKEDAE